MPRSPGARWPRSSTICCKPSFAESGRETARILSVDSASRGLRSRARKNAAPGFAVYQAFDWHDGADAKKRGSGFRRGGYPAEKLPCGAREGGLSFGGPPGRGAQRGFSAGKIRRALAAGCICPENRPDAVFAGRGCPAPPAARRGRGSAGAGRNRPLFRFCPPFAAAYRPRAPLPAAQLALPFTKRRFDRGKPERFLKNYSGIRCFPAEERAILFRQTVYGTNRPKGGASP